jgi:hypothetical protein
MDDTDPFAGMGGQGGPGEATPATPPVSAAPEGPDPFEGFGGNEGQPRWEKEYPGSKQEALSKFWEETKPGFTPWGIAKGVYETVRTLPQTIEQSLPPSSEHGFVPTDPERDQARIAAQTQLGALGVSPAPGPVGKLGVPVGPGSTIAPTIGPREGIAAASTRLGEQGTPVSVPDIAVRGPVAQKFAGSLKEIPIVGAPLVSASKKYASQIGQATAGTAEQIGSGKILTAGDAAKNAIVDWITGKSNDVAGRVYDAADAMMNPDVRRPLQSTMGKVSDIMADRANATISGTSKAVGLVSDAIGSADGLNYQGLKKLRSYVGEQMNQSVLPEGMDRGELKQIYGSMTDDLRETARAAGGDQGLSAFDKANRVYQQIANRREDLAKIIGNDSSAAPELVMNRLEEMAGSKARADIQRLTQARKAIGPDAWDQVASSIINHMGRDTRGEFSPTRFLTAYGKISDDGKRLLFNSANHPNLSQSLNDIATVSTPADTLAKYGNVSGTGPVAALVAAFAHPLKALMAVVGGVPLSRVWSRPITAQATAKWMRAYQNAQSNNPTSISAFKAATSNLKRTLNQTGLIQKTRPQIRVTPSQEAPEEPPMKHGGRVWKTRHDRVKAILDRHGATL